MVGLVSQMSESDLSKMMGMLKGGAKPKEIPAVNGDFYELGKTLNPKEREIQLKVREFMEREIKPIANDYWNRAEFPMHIIPKMAELNIAGLTYHGYDCPGHSALLEGFIAMEMARVDTSISTFFRSPKWLIDGIHLSLWIRGAKANVAAQNAEAGENRSLRIDRTGSRFGCGRRIDYYLQARRGCLENQRTKEMDRKRNFFGYYYHLG